MIKTKVYKKTTYYYFMQMASMDRNRMMRMNKYSKTLPNIIRENIFSRHLMYENLISRGQFFTFQSDSKSYLSDITLHIDEIVNDITKYIIRIDVKTDTFDESVDGNMLNVYHYITKEQVSYDYEKKITKIPLRFGPIVDKEYIGKMTFQIFTTGSYKLLSIHAKKLYMDDLYQYTYGVPFLKIHHCMYMDRIYCNKPCQIDVRFAFLIYVSGIHFNDVSEIIINVDGKKFCNCKKSTDFVWKEIKNGILLFADVDPVSSIYHYKEGDFTSYSDEIKNLSSICVKTIDDTKTNVLSIHYLSYLNPEQMYNQLKLNF